MFRIICECGNEAILKPEKDEEFNEEREGYYVSSSDLSMTFYGGHDEVSLICDKCKKSIWTFT